MLNARRPISASPLPSRRPDVFSGNPEIRVTVGFYFVPSIETYFGSPFLRSFETSRQDAALKSQRASTEAPSPRAAASRGVEREEGWKKKKRSRIHVEYGSSQHNLITSGLKAVPRRLRYGGRRQR